MNHFRHFARQMLEYRGLLILTMTAAIFDALCAFGGLNAIAVVIDQLFSKGESFRDLATAKLIDPQVVRWVGDQSHLAEYIPADPFNAFLALMGALLVLTIIGSCFRFIYQYFAITVSFRTVMKARAQAFHRLIHLPMSTIVTHGTADNMSRIVRDCNTIARGLNAIIGKSVRSILMGAVAIVTATIHNWQLTAFFLICMPLIAIVIRKFGKRIRRASKAAMAEYGRMIGAIQESMQGIRVVKLHQAEGYERRRFNTINRQVWIQEMRSRTARAMSSPVIETLAMIGMMFATTFAAWLIYKQGTESTDLIVVLAMLLMAGAALRPLANLNNDLQEARAAATRVHEILDLEVEANTRDEVGKRGDMLTRHSQSVRFENVVFTYPTADAPALNGITLDVPQGTTCAIVGGNGSGKSTLLNLLPRLYEPQSGRVLIDGKDIATVSLPSVRQQIAMVTQDTMLFSGTIGDNITYGQRHVHRQRMIDAATHAHAHSFISELPDGYDTDIGEWGARLSGGQRQRIAIARAILRDPAILILDEATSQIDADSEAQINAAIDQLTQDRTTFVIAHRLSTVINADVIVVMKDGRIVDKGKHNDLLQRCEEYKLIAKTQLGNDESKTH